MNSCIYCGNPIPDKTLSGKSRQFCNKSCARKHYCQTNPERLSEAGRKSFETIRDTKPEILKHRGRTTSNKRKAYDDLKASGHYKKMSDLGTQAMLDKYGDYFIRDLERQTKIKNGKWIDYSKFDYCDVKRYTRAVRRLTTILYGSAGEGYHWDHIVPISKAYMMGISPKLLCDQINIQRLKAKCNLSKGSIITDDAKIILEGWGIDIDDLF